QSPRFASRILLWHSIRAGRVQAGSESVAPLHAWHGEPSARRSCRARSLVFVPRGSSIEARGTTPSSLRWHARCIERAPPDWERVAPRRRPRDSARAEEVAASSSPAATFGCEPTYSDAYAVSPRDARRARASASRSVALRPTRGP